MTKRQTEQIELSEVRDIKFRAWDSHNKSWLNQNALVIYQGKVLCNIVDVEDIYTMKLDYMKGVHLQQYTGLKDKNGKEIYEGDIVKALPDYIGFIVFGNYIIGEDDYGIKHQTPCFCIEFQDDSGHCGISGDWYVIGNIYENPELLEGEQNE